MFRKVFGYYLTVICRYERALPCVNEGGHYRQPQRSVNWSSAPVHEADNTAAFTRLDSNAAFLPLVIESSSPRHDSHPSTCLPSEPARCSQYTVMLSTVHPLCFLPGFLQVRENEKLVPPGLFDFRWGSAEELTALPQTP